MRSFFLLSLFVGCMHAGAFAQRSPEAITLKNGFFGWQFQRGEQKLKAGEVADLLVTNSEASRLFSSARSNNTLASIVGSIGGFMFGYTLGTSAGGGKANWTVGGIGAGLAIASIPLSVKAMNQARKALILYHDGTKTGYLEKVEVRLALNQNGIGLMIQF